MLYMMDKKETITIRLTKDQKAFVEKMARACHMSSSEYMRKMILGSYIYGSAVSNNEND